MTTMGQSYGYGSVTEQGFVGFEMRLSEGAWSAVDVKGLASADGTLEHAVAKLGVLPMSKLRVREAIAVLVGALAGQSAAADLDDVWDRVQTRLDAHLALKAADDDAAVAAAARRCRGALLAGNGTAQTQYTLRREVDFGRTQVKLAATKPLADDVALVGIAATIKRVAETTEALAKEVPEGAGDRPRGRAVQIRAAWSGCVAAFNGVHDDLTWLLAHTLAGAERERVAELLAPFEALLEDNMERSAPSKTTEDAPPADDKNTKPTG